MGSDSIEKRCRFGVDKFPTRWFEIAYILLLPITVWLLYRYSLFNNNDGFLDAWIYFGYVHNFPDLIERYGLPYYSVRFGLIFPLIAFVKGFGPINGYFAFIYSMYLLAGIPLYLLFRKCFSVHAAAFAYAVLVSSVWFARTALWTYPDASAVPYLMAATALIFLETKHRRLANFVIGLLIGLAANSNLFALSVAGLSGVAYLVYHKGNLWEKLRYDMPWMGGGFFAVFAVGAVGFYICCQRLNYLDATLNLINWSLAGSAQIYQISFWSLLSVNCFYLLPFLTLSMVAVVKKVNARTRPICVSALSYLLAVTIFFVGSRFAVQSAFLEYFYYFSFLLPPCLVSFVLVPLILAENDGLDSQSINFALAAFLVPPVIVSNGFPANTENMPLHWIWIIFAISLLLVLLAIRFKKLSPHAIVCFSLSIQLSFLSTLSQAPALFGLPVYAQMYGASENVGMSRYRLGLKFLEVVPRYKDEYRPVYFWYSNADKLANSLQSMYLWEYSRAMDSDRDKPGLPSSNGLKVDLLQTRSSLVLFDREKRVVNEGVEELRHIGIRFTLNKIREICEQSICYTIAVLEVRGGSEKLLRDWRDGEHRDVKVVLNWSAPGAGANVERDGPITTITTPATAWNYGGVATIEFSEPRPAERGLVRVLVMVKGANAGLGFTGDDHSNFIKRIEIHPVDEPQEIYFQIENLNEVKKLVVQSWGRDKSAKVQILEFAIRGQR